MLLAALTLVLLLSLTSPAYAHAPDEVFLTLWGIFFANITAFVFLVFSKASARRKLYAVAALLMGIAALLFMLSTPGSDFLRGHLADPLPDSYFYLGFFLTTGLPAGIAILLSRLKGPGKTSLSHIQLLVLASLLLMSTQGAAYVGDGRIQELTFLSYASPYITGFLFLIFNNVSGRRKRIAVPILILGIFGMMFSPSEHEAPDYPSFTLTTLKYMVLPVGLVIWLSLSKWPKILDDDQPKNEEPDSD